MTVTACGVKGTPACGFCLPNVGSWSPKEAHREGLAPGDNGPSVGGAKKRGSRIKIWMTFAVSGLIQDHWFPRRPSGHLNCKCCTGTAFWTVHRQAGGGGVVPTAHAPSLPPQSLPLSPPPFPLFSLSPPLPLVSPSQLPPSSSAFHFPLSSVRLFFLIFKTNILSLPFPCSGAPKQYPRLTCVGAVWMDG